MEITKETLIGEMLESDMGIAYVLMQCGMHCVGCPSSIYRQILSVRFRYARGECREGTGSPLSAFNLCKTGNLINDPGFAAHTVDNLATV